MIVEVIDKQNLTNRQAEVLSFIARGLCDKQIAKSMSISPKTVAALCAELYGRMELDRTQGNVRCLSIGKAIAKGVIAIK